MKIAAMSDVHANPSALCAALADARQEGCRRHLFLGDITGYGYDVKRALEMVREQVKPNPFAKDAEIVFADGGKGVLTNGAAFGRWTADFEAASALATKSGKDILVAFVGPGWCRWGDEMERDVFNTTDCAIASSRRR